MEQNCDLESIAGPWHARESFQAHSPLSYCSKGDLELPQTQVNSKRCNTLQSGLRQAWCQDVRRPKVVSPKCQLRFGGGEGRGAYFGSLAAKQFARVPPYLRAGWLRHFFPEGRERWKNSARGLICGKSSGASKDERCGRCTPRSSAGPQLRNQSRRAAPWL